MTSKAYEQQALVSTMYTNIKAGTYARLKIPASVQQEMDTRVDKGLYDGDFLKMAEVFVFYSKTEFLTRRSGPPGLWHAYKHA